MNPPPGSFTGRLEWRAVHAVSFAGLSIPASMDLPVAVRGDAGHRPDLPGIRPNTARELRLKRWAWPIARATSLVRGHQYVQYILARWMKPHLTPDSRFLEVGPGDMSFRRFLPRTMSYNTIDYAVSEFQLRRVVARDARVNLALASVTHVPLDDNTVNVAMAIEMLQHVDDIERALDELRRIIKPGGRLLVSVGNGHCHKVDRKGRNRFYVHFWRFADVRALVEKHGFRVVQSKQTGVWLPLPRWITRDSIHLPISSRNEYYNCLFLFELECVKPDR